MDYPLWTLGKFGVRLVDCFRKTDSIREYPLVDQSQWLSHDELKGRQWQAVQDLIRHAVAKVPYYKRIFGELGLSAEDIQTPADLERLPVLTKEIIRREGKAMMADDFDTWQPRPKATSGSTGVPLKYFIDRRSHSYHWAFIWRAWNQVGFRPGDAWTTLSGGALVPAEVDFKQRTYLWLNGAIHQPSYHLRDEDFARYAKLLRDRPFPLLYAYPSSLRLFAEWLRENSAEIAVSHFFTTSEALPPAWRSEIEVGAGGTVHDIYGNNDGGILSFECDQYDGYHLNMEGVFVEIVNDDGHQVPDGDSGEIVSTNLLNYAMPFIRYAPGDGGSIRRDPCPCGRGLERISNLQGRIRDFIVTGDGRRVHGAFFNHFEPFYNSDWIEAFQVRQTEVGAIRLIMQPKRHPAPIELQAVLSELKLGLGEDMRIEVELLEEIPRTSAGKYRLIVSELD
ncbi:MAG: phenylacetate--CoA ligase family protein [bacterium]|nr:phenylacetate--CoA ligase family protein [bacterium]